jgi:hypothetical protein
LESKFALSIFPLSGGDKLVIGTGLEEKHGLVKTKEITKKTNKIFDFFKRKSNKYIIK